MDHLGGLSAFVQAAEAQSFVAAGRVLGVSASAIGKSIARLEQRVGVRLFHRSTRSIRLTTEGKTFLESCRRILLEIEQAEQALASSMAAPRGRLRISLPLVGDLLNPVLVEFARQYPDILLDVDCSDRRVDLIEEGFDAVVRVGETADSRLMSRKLGTFHLQLVAAPAYLRQHGVPARPQDLLRHRCLFYKFPSTGKLEAWPLADWERLYGAGLPAALECSAIDTLIHFARQGMGIACLPDFAVRDDVAGGSLHGVLPRHTRHSGDFQILWPSSKQLAPRLRVLIDFLSERVFPHGRRSG